MTNLVTQLADQLDWHWRAQLRPRLEGLSDNEYFWQPVPNCWTVHPEGSVDFAFPAPVPAEGQYAERPLIELVLHINREAIHHGAEIACLRDLYLHHQAHRPTPTRRIEKCPPSPHP